MAGTGGVGEAGCGVLFEVLDDLRRAAFFEGEVGGFEAVDWLASAVGDYDVDDDKFCVGLDGLDGRSGLSRSRYGGLGQRGGEGGGEEKGDAGE